MANSVCPWWIGYLLLSPFRRWSQNPTKILKPYLDPGMTAVDLGCAMGFFTLDLARLAGEQGRVVAVDLQQRMLDGLVKRAQRAGLSERIETRKCASEDLGLADLEGELDFALAFAVVHELPNTEAFFLQVRTALRPGARLLVAEPSGHVTLPEFEASLKTAKRIGFELVDRPSIRRSHGALLEKPEPSR